MKKYSIPVLLTIICIAIIASCNKKTTPALGRADMLRSGKWTISSGTVTMKLPNGKDTTLNYLNFIPKCHLDDYLIFHAGNDAAIFAGEKCNPGEPDSTTFSWSLSDNNNALSLYNGYEFTYGIVEGILPFVFDTTQTNPYLVLDTLEGVFDTTATALTAGYTKQLIVLDTIWDLTFDSVGLVTSPVSNAQFLKFSQSSFTINYSIVGYYPDSLGNHTNQLIISSSPPDTIDYNPIIATDTVLYSVTYTNS